MLLLSELRLAEDKSVTPDIEFSSGSVNVVLGRNHSGKTALCRLLAGLESRASGEVTIDGIKKSNGVDRSWPVGMVYQAFVNYPNWNVANNIASPLKAGALGRLSASEIDRRVREVAEKVRIGDLLHRMPDELSGGQQQRLAIARALAKEPKVLVMDEPLVNIDYKLREELIGELKSLVGDTDTCLVYATSDPQDALLLGDSTLLLDDSEVLQVGAPLELYRNPDSLKAANLMSDPGVNRLSGSEAVRPEHVSLQPEDGLSFSALIKAVETNGATTYLHVDVELADEASEWVVKLRGMEDVQAGEQITLYVRPEDVLTFAGDGQAGVTLG